MISRQICGGHRQCQHAPADDVQRRVHSGHDPVFAQLHTAADHLLIALRHQPRHGKGISDSFRRVAADKSAVGGGLWILRRHKGRNNLHRRTPAIRTRIFIEALHRFGRGVVAHFIEKIHHQTEVAIAFLTAHAGIVALIHVQHGGGISRNACQGCDLLGRTAPCARQWPHAICDAVAFATTVIVIGRLSLGCRAASCRCHHILNIRGKDVRIKDCAAYGGFVRQSRTVRRRNGCKTLTGRRGNSRIDLQRAWAPQGKKAGYHAHAGIGVERRKPGITTLVRGDIVDKSGHVCRRRAVGEARIPRRDRPCGSGPIMTQNRRRNHARKQRQINAKTNSSRHDENLQGE